MEDGSPNVSGEGAEAEYDNQRKVTPADDESNTMSVTLSRNPDAGFGIAYRVMETTTEGPQIIITAVVPGGPADDWNWKSPISSVICTGDTILAVNNKSLRKRSDMSEAKLLIMELRSNTEAVLQILKSGPRWHLQDLFAANQQHEDTLDADEEDEVEPLAPLKWVHVFSIFVICFLPPVIIVLLFSAMSIGLKTYGFFASYHSVILGDGVVCLAAGMVMVLYIIDWFYWKNKVLKVLVMCAISELFFLGFTMKVRKYPSAPMVIGAFHVPVLLGAVRSLAMKDRAKRRFYLVAGVALLSSAVIICLAWLLWIFAGDNVPGSKTWTRIISESSKMYEQTKIKKLNNAPLVYAKHCDSSADLRQMASDARDEVQRACATVKTVWIMAYNCPGVMALCNFIMGIFCMGNIKWLDVHDSSRLAKVLKQFSLLLIILAMGFYGASSLSGASMRLSTTIMAFLGVSVLCLLTWFYLEIGHRAITHVVRGSSLMHQLIHFATSDWARSLFILATFGITIPGALFLNMLNQIYRKKMKTATTEGCFTKEATTLLVHLQNWNWASILCKTNMLVFGIFIWQVGISKATYVFLSWLNEQLAVLNLAVVVIVFFVIGFTMFLLPPVPGVPVYICSGIIIGARAKKENINFILGVMIAEAVSFLDKMLASSAQYLIGFGMGKSVKVQQLVGVDKVPIRSVEKILLRNGLGIAKCAILVGGPDWPTSVLCGILRLNLLQVLWGTCPVIITQLPCVIAGALMTEGPQGCRTGEQSSLQAMSSFALFGSIGLQIVSMVLAMYYITQVIEKNGKELAQSRPEHKPIEELTKAEELTQRCYVQVTKWSHLDLTRKIFLLSSTSLLLFCNFLFLMFDPVLFESFSLSSRISCEIADYGLDGNVMNLIRRPWGYVALGFFSLGCLFHYIFVKLVNSDTKLQLEKEKQAQAQALGLENPT